MTLIWNSIQLSIIKSEMSTKCVRREIQPGTGIQSTRSNRVGLIDTHAKLIDLHLAFAWTDTQKSTFLSVLEMH